MHHVAMLQVYRPGIGLGFHFDKDEHLLKSTGQMLQPIKSSILYLTGSDGSSGSSCSCGSHVTNSGCCSESRRQRQQQQYLDADMHHDCYEQQQQHQQRLCAKQLLDNWDGIRQGEGLR